MGAAVPTMERDRKKKGAKPTWPDTLLRIPSRGALPCEGTLLP
jgi:hypothetical protein